ncbi:MAG: hypothetical protein ACI807_001185 [Paracoccaceae bacterium]|jgi:hypothetical protein
MNITLSGSQITALSQGLCPEPLARAATRERAAARFARLLAARIGAESAEDLAAGILCAPDEAAAQARLAGALRPFAAAPGASEAGDAGDPGEDPQALRAAIAEGRIRGTAKRLRAIAEAGIVPPPPDFAAPTHARFRAALAEVVALAEAGDAAGLRAVEISAASSSPRAILRYRDAVLIALAKGA